MIVRRATLDQILPLRHAVLRPGRPLETARFDGDDEPRTVHVAAVDGDAVVGCATLVRRALDGEDAAQVRGMATRADLVRRGIGSAVLAFAEHVAVEDWGVRLLWCNARVAARAFYERAGWRVVSTTFDIADVGPHVRMVRRP